MPVAVYSRDTEREVVPEVMKIQQCLIRLHFNLGTGAADGKYGFFTEAAVKQFQRQQGLPDSGIVGPQTWNRLAELCPDIISPVTEGEEVIVVHPSGGGGTTTTSSAPPIEDIQGWVRGIYDMLYTSLDLWQTAYENFARVLQDVTEESTVPDFGGVLSSFIYDIAVKKVLSFLPSAPTSTASSIYGLMDNLSKELEQSRQMGENLKISRWIRDNITRIATAKSQIANVKEPSLIELKNYYLNSPEGEKLQIYQRVNEAWHLLENDPNRNLNYLLTVVAWEYIRSFDGSVDIFVQAAFWNRPNPISWLDTRDWKAIKVILNDKIPKGKQIVAELLRVFPAGLDFSSWGMRRTFRFQLGGKKESGEIAWWASGVPDEEINVLYDNNGYLRIASDSQSLWDHANPPFPWDGWLERLRTGLPPTASIEAVRG